MIFATAIAGEVVCITIGDDIELSKTEPIQFAYHQKPHTLNPTA